MPHSYIRVWIHAVWATKLRKPAITQDAEQNIYSWLNQELTDLGCPVHIINGMPDHIHALFRLNAAYSVKDVIKQIKGNTSHWINEQHVLPEEFSWQTGYGAFSVSESKIETVYRYIQRQKEHHQTQNFEEEFEWLVRHHGMIY